MDFKSKIVLIYGPTASGKSKFAIQLAKKINGEIINADSMQVYKELKILSARPSLKDYQSIRHHLYGFQSVKSDFSTGDWLKLTNKKILDLRQRKKVAILVGGTGLYFKALTDGLVKIPNIPVNFRNQIRNLNKKIGQGKFYKQLLKLDPLSNIINPTDTQRSIRAYEIKKFTKKSIHDWIKNTKTHFKKEEFYKIYINLSREKLLKKINIRTERMIKMGAINEVKKLIKLKVKKNKMVHKAIGINEIKDYLSGKNNLNEMKYKVLIKTRQYAKKQRTWSRGHMSDWHMHDHSQLKKVINNLG